MDQLFQLKEHLVIKLFILLFLMSFSFSCTQIVKRTSEKDDYLLVNEIVKQSREQNYNKEMIFDLKNDNEYVISIIKKLNKYKIEGNTSKLDSLKQSIGFALNLSNVTEKTKNLNVIFNEDEYEYLISQEESSEWNLNLVDKVSFEIPRNKNYLKIKISKPIYTKDNKFALVYVNKETRSGIYIYKKVKYDWSEHSIIAPLFTQPKVEKFND